ncbi:MAG: hypothetical protein ACK4N5_15085 [Myxococcales bacterium]
MRRLVVLAVLLAGCGEDVCGRLDEGISAAVERGRPCSIERTTLNVHGFDRASCGNGLSACSREDQERLLELAACLERLPTCDNANGDPYVNGLTSCVSLSLRISRPCVNALRVFPTSPQ